MLISTALGVPRFSITSDLRSSSTRRRSFPKFARARRAETTIVPFLPVVVVVAINSPFQLIELYSPTGGRSTSLVGPVTSMWFEEAISYRSPAAANLPVGSWLLSTPVALTSAGLWTLRTANDHAVYRAASVIRFRFRREMHSAHFEWNVFLFQKTIHQFAQLRMNLFYLGKMFFDVLICRGCTL